MVLLAILACIPCLFSVCLKVDSLTLTLANTIEAGRCYPGVLCDPLENDTSCSWSDFCWKTTPGESNNGAEYPPFVDYLPDSGLVEPKLFREGFVTFSSLVSINLFSELPGNLL